MSRLSMEPLDLHCAFYFRKLFTSNPILWSTIVALPIAVLYTVCLTNNLCLRHSILPHLFSATNTSITDRMDDMEFKVINKYRHAAGFGHNRRALDAINNNATDSSSVCEEKYNDCIISLLNVAKKLIDTFLV